MLQKKIFLFLLFQRPVEESCVIVFIIVRYLSMFSFSLLRHFFRRIWPVTITSYHRMLRLSLFLPDTDSAFQVVVPVLPGFLGCIVGAVLFGAMGGFWCNYIGICAGSIIAFALARCYGAPFVKHLFPAKQYETWIDRLQNKRSYTCFFFLCIYSHCSG